MSTTANVSAARKSANTMLPQLSKKGLDERKKGPTVEIWFVGDRYMTEVAGVQQWDNHHLLRSIPTALIRYFSERYKRELTESDTKRVMIPFAKKPTQLVLGWMTAGGGDNLDTPAVTYPKTERRPLELLRDLAQFLEIDSLAKRIETDIAALPKVLPPVPAASSVQKRNEAKAARAERTCYFCGKAGHIVRVCRERKALYVNESNAPTYSMKDGSLVVKTSDPKQADTKQPSSKQLDQNQPKAQQPDPKEPEPAKAGSTQPSSTREKLIPLKGYIRARDSEGWQYELSFRNIEMEVDWPVTGGQCKVTGTAMVSSW